GTGHIGHAANLTLTPEQLVIIEFRHAVEVNGVDCDHASFAQTGERRNDNVTAGREGDSPIKFNRRLVVFGANPSCTQRFREFAMRFAASGNVDFAVPRLQYMYREMSGRSESEKSDAFTFFYASDSQ